MFDKIRAKIYRTIMIIAAILIALMIIPSMAVFSGMFYNTFQSMAKNKLDRSLSASRIFIDSIMSTTDNLAINPIIIDTLNGTRMGSLASLLDNACAYSLEISAITVYGTDGKLYTSSGVINPPTVEDLKTHRDIADFFADGKASEYVSLRTSHIIKSYDNIPYDEQAGIVSCCRKVYGENGRVIGYIFSDIMPPKLFAYFSFNNDARLKNSIAMVTFDGGYLISEKTDYAQSYLITATDTVVKKRLVISSIRNFYGGTVRVAVPVSPLYEDIAIILSIFIICGGILLTVTHFIAKSNADRVTERLNGLLDKMTLSARQLTDG